MMIKHMLCSNCGYDMSGAEYIANTVDSSLANEWPIYSNAALLEINSKPQGQVVCPYCKTIGSWTT